VDSGRKLRFLWGPGGGSLSPRGLDCRKASRTLKQEKRQERQKQSGVLGGLKNIFLTQGRRGPRERKREAKSFGQKKDLEPKNERD